MVLRGDGLKGVVGLDELLALEYLAQRLDRFRGQLGEVGQGAGLDLAALAIALSKQDGRG